MQSNRLYEELPFLKKIDKVRAEQFIDYFKTAPDWLIQKLSVEDVEKDVIFVRENAPVDYVYIVVKGSIEALDYRFQGVVYEFMRFDRIYAMGGMEYIMDKPTYGTTLRTVTKCKIVKISLKDFSKWMSQDIVALKKEAQRVGEYLFEDARKGRAFLFLNGEERVAMLLVERYERYARNGILFVKGGRQHLSNATGLCVKTVQRAIKKLADDEMISKDGAKLFVTNDQYEKMRKLVAKVVDMQ